MLVAIVNQKGGTGKTTTTVNLGFALSNCGYNILLVDMDPQGNLTYSLGINEYDFTMADLLSGGVETDQCIIHKNNLSVIPTNTELARLEMAKIDMSNTAYKLKEVLSVVNNEYDYILIDCPPSLSWLTINSLTAANKVLIPMQLDVFSIQGLTQILDTIGQVQAEYNNSLEVIGVLPVMVDRRKKLTSEVMNYIEDHFEVPLFHHYIRTNVKAAEAPSFGESVLNYAPNSKSASDYRAFANEILETI